MKLELEVLASTAIKRKKPWPKLAWIGETQESIFLMDSKRLSVLYIPSGKTKRRINRIHNLLEDVVVMNNSDNGQFIVGLLKSGDLFLWHKDTDMLKFIHGMPDLAWYAHPPDREHNAEPSSAGSADTAAHAGLATTPYLCVAGDGTKLLLVIQLNNVFVWEMDADQALFVPGRADVRGSWSQVKPDSKTTLPQPSDKETSITAAFFIDEVLGLCCCCSLVFTEGNDVCVSTATLRWLEVPDIGSYGLPTFRVEWNTLKYPLKDLIHRNTSNVQRPVKPIRSSGVYVSSHARSGCLLAVAINQRSSHDNQIMFVSPYTDAVTVTSLKGSGAKVPVTTKHARNYWVAALQWTYDDLFLVAMTKQGSLCMLTRLGEPLVLQTCGCGIDMGPKPFLPLLPLILFQVSTYQTDENTQETTTTDLDNSSLFESDPLRQRYSVTAHPRLPIVLLSDGYMVTAVQLPGEMSCLSLMKGLVLESNKYLRRIRDQQHMHLTLYDSLRRQGRVGRKLSLSCGQSAQRMGLLAKSSLQQQKARTREKRVYRFEEPDEDTMSSTQESEILDFINRANGGPAMNMGDAGKIMFGDVDNLQSTVDFCSVSQEEDLSLAQQIDHTQSVLLLAWCLSVSHTGMWTEEHEQVANNIGHNLVRLFMAILHSTPAVAKELGVLMQKHQNGKVAKNIRMVKVLGLLQMVLQLLSHDTINQHFLVCALKFAHSTIHLLLNNKDIGVEVPRIQQLHGAFIVLRYMESILGRVYGTIPKVGLSTCLTEQLQGQFRDSVEPVVFCHVWGALGIKSHRQRAAFCKKIKQRLEKLKTPRKRIKRGKGKKGEIQNYDDSEEDRFSESDENFMYEGAAKQKRFKKQKKPKKAIELVKDEGENRAGQLRMSKHRKQTNESEASELNPAQVNEATNLGDNSGGPLHSDSRFSLQGNCSEIIKRLGPAWKLLYRCLVVLYKTYTTIPKEPKEMKSLLAMLWASQIKLQMFGIPLTPRIKSSVQMGDKWSIEGSSEPAMKAWANRIQGITDDQCFNGLGQRLLLSLLYTLLLQDDLRGAIHMVEILIRKADLSSAAAICRQEPGARHSILGLIQEMPSQSKHSPPVYIRDSTVRGVVQSLARIMAAYFCNKSMFVYPPHAPRKIPPLLGEYIICQRVIPLYHDAVTNVVCQRGLSEVWTTERVLEYLLLSGLVSEAVWFSYTLGDWKTAFVLGVGCLEHSRINPPLYDRYSRHIRLPQELRPDNILQTKLKLVHCHPDSGQDRSAGLVVINEESDMNHMTKTLSDLMLAATISLIDITPWLLESLVGKLKLLTQEFTALVPEGLYLPAPPVYCPQPAITAQEVYVGEVLAEVERRREASSLTQLILLVLEGSHCSLPAARWYAKRVLSAHRRGQKFKMESSTDDPETPVLRECFIWSPSEFKGIEDDTSIHKVIACFRDFCSIIWLHDVRDRLSLSLRKKIKLLNKKMQHEGVSEEAWLQQCRDTLSWTIHMIPFTHFTGHETEIFSLALSLIIELPRSEETGRLLSEYFYDIDDLEPEIQDKLQLVLKDWQGVFLGQGSKPNVRKVNPGRSPRGMTLSFFFHKNAQEMEKRFRKKAKVFGEYEVYVFDPDSIGYGKETEAGTVQNGIMFVGSRPFECEEAYMHFLDTFYAVSFQKVLNAEADSIQNSTSKPLLVRYAQEIRKTELGSLSHKALTSFQKRQIHNVEGNQKLPSSPARPPVSPRDLSKAPSSRSNLPKSPTKPRGLFRSQSFSDIRSNKHWNKRSGGSPVLERKWSSSQTDLSKMYDSDSSLYQSDDHISNQKSRAKYQKKSTGPNAQRRGSLRRSASVSDIDDRSTWSRSDEEFEEQEPDSLAKPVIQPWLLDQMDFGKKFDKMEQLLQWLTRWASRNHLISSAVGHKGIDEGFEDNFTKPAMRIRVLPRMMVYSLWLLEQQYQTNPAWNDEQDRKSSEVDSVSDAEKRKTLEGVNPFSSIDDGVDGNETVIHVPTATKRSENIAAVIDEVDPSRSFSKSADKPKNKKIKKDNRRKKPHKQESLEEPVIVQRNEEEIAELREPVMAVDVGETSVKSVKIPSEHVEEEETTSRLEASLTLVTDDKEPSVVREDTEEDKQSSVTNILQRLRQNLRNKQVAKQVDKNDKDSLNTTLGLAADSPRSEVNHNPDPGMSTSKDTDREGEETGENLRDMVRKEFRKIMEAQHKGILVMLGALDDSAENIAEAVGHKSPKTYTISSISRKKGKDYTDETPRTPFGNTLEKHLKENRLNSMDKDDKSETDLDITPLPSEDISVLDKPLTVSDLNRSSPVDDKIQQQPMHNYRKELLSQHKPVTNVGIHGALKELQHLKKHSPSKNVNDKENRPMLALETPTRNPHNGILQVNDPRTDQPFSRVMQMLRGFNQTQPSLGSGVLGTPQPPSLLQMTPERDVPHSLPRIPIQAWQDNTVQGMQGSSHNSVPKMPLLHLDNGYASRNLLPERDYSTSMPNIPHRGTPLPFGGPPLPGSPHRVPLLNLQPHTYRPMTNITTPDGTPSLVPPQEIIAFEQKKYHKSILKNKQGSEFISQQMASRAQQQFDGGIPLLKTKVEPFEPRDERNNEKRKQRRRKILQDENKKAKKSDPVNVENVSYSHADTQVTPATTPRLTSQGVQADDGTDPEEEPETLHDGYALTPGMFDEYLVHQDELGSAVDNNAKLQYKAVMGTRPKKVNFHGLPKADVSTETDGPGWADRGTSMSIDMGLDPVQDAISRYAAARRPNSGGMLPPDVFLGLRFTDKMLEKHSNEGSDNGRAFINVVDIQGDLLEDIVSTVPQKEKSQREETHMVDMKGSPVKPKFRTSSPVRRSQDGHEEVEEEERVPGPDSVTANVLDGPHAYEDGFSMPSVDELSRSSRHRSKTAIRQRLNDMNLQAKALEQMANNMEKDFQNTKLMLHTVEQMSEAVDPEERDPDYPSARVVRPRPHSPDSEAFKDSKLKPSHIKQYNKEDREGTNEPAQFMVDEEDGISPRSRARDIRAHFGQSDDRLDTRTSGEKLNLTGLSGVSDIIGEVVAQGDIDTSLLGLTKNDTAKLLQRVLDSARSGQGRVVSDLDTTQLESPRQQRKRVERTEEEKQQLKEWMEKKRKEHTKEYSQKRGELRERERQPYHPSDDSKLGTLTLKEIMESEHAREERRRIQQGAFMERRIEAASHLMTDMLSERPDLPEQPPPRVIHSPRMKKTPSRDSSGSPVRREISPARDKGGKNVVRKIAAANKSNRQLGEKPGRMVSTKGHHVGRTAGRNVNQDLDRMEVRPDYYMSIKDSYDEAHRKYLWEREAMKKGEDRGLQSHTLDSEGLSQTGTGIAAYTRYMEDMEDSSGMMETRDRPVPSPRRKLPTEPQQYPKHEKPEETTYRPKPFTEMVKLQRPDLIRKGRQFRPKPVPYVERLSQLGSRQNTPRDQQSLKAQQRLYGTKRIPGTFKASRVAPRTVKTYAERLHEMKHTRSQYPTTPRCRTALPGERNDTSPRRRQQVTHRGQPVRKKPLKTMTYAEQLQSLQPPKEMYRTGRSPPHQTVVRRSHKAPHDPKTYSQQLQELQPHSTATFTSTYGGTSERKLYRTTPLRSLVRSGPYPDPYREGDEMEEDGASVISPWSVGEDVKKILMEDGSGYLAASATATDADISDMTELQRLAGNSYADLVDVDEIAAAASVSEGSIMSFIDWDQVDQLIGDVH